MWKYIEVIILLVLSTAPALAAPVPQWQTTATPINPGASVVFSSVAADAGGVYAAGAEMVDGRPVGCHLEKRGQNGALLWSSSVGVGAVACSGVAADPGGVTVGATVPGYPGGNFLTRLDLAGNVVWSSYLGIIADIKAGNTGIYAVSLNAPGYQITKYAFDGAVIWSRMADVPVSGIYHIYSDLAVSSSGVFAAGSVQFSDGSEAAVIERRDLNTGAIIWSDTLLRGNGYTSAKSISVNNEGVYVAFYSTGVNDLAKYSIADGSLVWSKSPVLPTDPTYDLVLADSTGIFVCAGRLQKLDFSGSVTWLAGIAGAKLSKVGSQIYYVLYGSGNIGRIDDL